MLVQPHVPLRTQPPLAASKVCGKLPGLYGATNAKTSSLTPWQALTHSTFSRPASKLTKLLVANLLEAVTKISLPGQEPF